MFRPVIVAAILLCWACKTTSKQAAPEPQKPVVGPASVKAVPVDRAVEDFQAEASAIRAGSPDWKDVASRMEALTRKHPRYGLAWYNLGVAYENQGRLNDARTAYERAFENNNELREAKENLAALSVKEGQAADAIRILRDLVERDPGAAQARVALANHLLAQGDNEGAQQLSEEALLHMPTNLDAYCVLAQVAQRNKDYLRARLVAAQGLKISKDNGCLHHVLGVVALGEKETAVALSEFERAVTHDPRRIEARFYIAQISLGYRDFKKAIASYQAVAEVDPKNVEAFVNLGVAYKGSGQFEAAEKAYLRAIENTGGSGSPEAHYNLGVLYLRNMKRLDDAKEQLKRYLQLSDDSSEEVFKMLEEIDQMKAMAEEEQRMMEEAKRQEEIEKKMAAEEAKRAAEEAEAAKKAGEPGAPQEGGAEPSDKAAESPTKDQTAEPEEPMDDEPPPASPEKEKKKSKKAPPKKKSAPPRKDVPKAEDSDFN